MSAARSLKDLLAGYGVPAPEVELTGIAMDSRRVRAGDLFLACSGRGTHALSHLDQAVERGAVAVVWEPAPGWSPPAAGIPEVALPGLSGQVGEIAARFYGRPSESMFCVGVTGTDGKTSTAYLLAQAFDHLDMKGAYIGTLGLGRVGALRSATHTTPDAVSLQRELADLRDDGVGAVAMEVSSHALDQNRVGGVSFDVAVLTNITRDHLDYHGTVENYAAAKRRLFERAGLRAVVLNRDDAYGQLWAQQLTTRCVAYGIDGGAPDAGDYLIARNVQTTLQGIRFELHSSWGEAPVACRLLGRFNVYNSLAVLSVLLMNDVALEDAISALAQVHTVPGRIEGFRGKRAAPLVVVDYAHTPEALRQLLTAVRAHTSARLSCVFGCGGDRDRGKRPLMGAAAAELSDFVIVTDDNPRSEDPQSIAQQIVSGISDTAIPVDIIHDRAEAIRVAVTGAGKDDVVVVAGKGHEETQTYGATARPFSDRRFVAELVGAAHEFGEAA